MSCAHYTRPNHLPYALPADERARILTRLELVPMAPGKTVYEQRTPMRHVYAPTTCTVSLLHVMEDGTSVVIAVIGNERIVGVSLFMCAESTTRRAVVRCAGHAYRLTSQHLKDAFHHAGPVQRILLRYTQALLTRMSQTASCKRNHHLDQQLCRWLLLSLDRLSSNGLSITRKLIANMLGARHEGLTEAAGKLQRADLIHYSRGKITILLV